MSWYLAQRNLDRWIGLLNHYAERLGLKLNEEKTQRLTLTNGASLDFLGFRFHTARNSKTHKRLILVYPGPGSQERFWASVRRYVHHSIPLRVKKQVEHVNGYLQGWIGYFRLGNASATLHDLRRFVEERIRCVT